jgi:hypothetical protein
LDFWVEETYLGFNPCCSLPLLGLCWISCALLLQQLQRKTFWYGYSEYLIDSNSKVVAAPAKHQLSNGNGLIESHWMMMVHMGCTYLTEKQMPRTFWFYAITHAVCMMKAIPGKHLGYLASPFLLVHGVGHDE